MNKYLALEYSRSHIDFIDAMVVSKLLLTDEQIPQKNNLSFDSLWYLYANWFEAPNIRRGGWSGVIRQPVLTETGTADAFIKRQENHLSKTLLHPIKGEATFCKEYRNIQRLTKKNIPTVEPLFFEQKDMKAILVTKALNGYMPLDSSSLELNTLEKRALLTKVAEILRLMHRHHFQHNCLFSKHIFVKHVNGEWRVRFIDLEKLKWQLFKRNAIHRDLITLYRHSIGNWSRNDRLFFFRAYQKEEKLSSRSKKLWRRLELKNAKKSKVVFSKTTAVQ